MRNQGMIDKLREHGFSRKQAEIVEKAIRTNRLRHAGLQMQAGFSVHWDMIECPNGELVSIELLKG